MVQFCRVQCGIPAFQRGHCFSRIRDTTSESRIRCGVPGYRLMLRLGARLTRFRKPEGDSISSLRTSRNLSSQGSRWRQAETNF